MNVDLLSLIVAACLAGVGALLMKLQYFKNKASKLQREKDVEDIKKEAYNEVSKEHLDHLLAKLNRRVADDKSKRGH